MKIWAGINIDDSGLGFIVLGATIITFHFVIPATAGEEEKVLTFINIILVRNSQILCSRARVRCPTITLCAFYIGPNPLH